MPDQLTDTHDTVANTAHKIGRGTTAVYKYIQQTRGITPDPLDLIETTTGAFLHVEKTRAYSQSRRNGRPPQWTGQNA